jgi:hypothetical protein
MYRRTLVGTFLICLAGLSAAVAQNAKNLPEKNIERIIGTWKVARIMSGGTEVAKNPTSGQWIEFREDGKYVNKTTSLDSGSFRMNETQSVLYLESVVNPSTTKNEDHKTVEWDVTLKEDTMTLQQHQGSGKGHRDTMKYVYMKIADGSTARKN